MVDQWKGKRFSVSLLAGTKILVAIISLGVNVTGKGAWMLREGIDPRRPESVAASQCIMLAGLQTLGSEGEPCGQCRSTLPGHPEEQGSQLDSGRSAWFLPSLILGLS
jgi:hypothetical protein